MIGCFLKKRNNLWKLCLNRPLKVCELRCVKSHWCPSRACPILSLQSHHPTGKDSLRGKEVALFYLWFSPNSNKTSPSHVKMLNVAARASWWQWSRCLRRSTKADFDIWDDKKAHTLRSSNRHFKIVVSAQTWCSGLNQHLWSHL